MKSEARYSDQAHGQAMDYNRAVHVELQAYRAQVQTHETHIQTHGARIGSLETLVATLVAQTSSLVLLSAPTARGLAISPETIEASLLLPTTTREPKGKIKEFSLALSVELSTAGTNPNSNVVTGTFLLNNHYASFLFDTGADRSFVSSAFSSLIDIIPTTLDHGYDVDLANGVII
ncbi:putative reverse transcriptase domain-containing protein [Tanacetum coccineum]